MVSRFVHLPLSPGKTQVFLEAYRDFAPKILHQSGCMGLELYKNQDVQEGFVLLTRWATMAEMEAYRHSDAFLEAWGKIRLLLGGRADSYTLRMYMRGTDGE